MSEIYFENLSQAIIFEAELKGQISDGFWENSRPYNHYVTPCDTEVFVDKESPGSHFDGPVKNYNFSSSELLEYIAHRMIEYGKIGKIFENDEDLSVNAIAFLAENWREVSEIYETGDGFDIYKEYITEYNLTLKKVKKLIDNIEKVSYNRKDLKKDLNRMKKIWKNNL